MAACQLAGYHFGSYDAFATLFDVSEVSETVTDGDDPVSGQLANVEVLLRLLTVSLVCQKTNMKPGNFDLYHHKIVMEARTIFTTLFFLYKLQLGPMSYAPLH